MSKPPNAIINKKIPIDAALQNLAYRHGYAAVGGQDTEVTFKEGLFTALFVYFGAVFVLGMMGLFSAMGALALYLLLSYIMTNALAAVIAPIAATLVGSGFLVHAWREDKTWMRSSGSRAPSDLLVEAMFQALCRVRQHASDGAEITMIWQQHAGLGGSLSALVPMKGGGPMLKVEVENRGFRLLARVGPSGREEAARELIFTRKRGWRDARKRPVDDTAAAIGSFVGGFLAQRATPGGPKGLSVRRRRPTPPESMVSQAVTASMSPIEIPPIEGVAKRPSKLPFYLGLMLATSPLSVGTVWLAWFSSQFLASSNPDTVAYAMVGLMVAWFMVFFNVGLLFFSGDKPKKADRKARTLKRTVGHVVLDGVILEIDGRRINLEEPFAVKVFKSQSGRGQACVVVELSPRSASEASRRARFGVRLKGRDTEGALERLDVEVDLVEEAFFMEHLWPTLVAWSSAHGQPLDIDFDAGVRLPTFETESQQQTAEVQSHRG